MLGKSMRVAAFALLTAMLAAQPSGPQPLGAALDLLRDSKTGAARAILRPLLEKSPRDAELYYQLARSYLIDFHERRDPAQQRTALALAMEALGNAIERNGDHIPALKSKAVLHARAELLYYDPDLAYKLAARVAELQPSANEYLLSLTDWLSGEVRFSAESAHRVPHDPLLGLDRSIALLDRVIDSSVPYSNEEALGFYQLGRTLSRRGDFPGAVRYLERALSRPANEAMSAEIMRETGAAQFRMGNMAEAARTFYRLAGRDPSAENQWLLHIAIEAWKDAAIELPAAMRFPVPPKKSAPQIAFQDMAPAMGVDRLDGNGTCAVGDYDGDGRPDLFLSGSGTFLGAYRNEGGRFREVTGEVGLGNVPSGYSMNLVDVDGDGRLDLYLALNGWSGPMANRLYRNTPTGFVDISKESGAADAGSGFVSLWGDLDNDGDLDLVVANGVLKDGSTPQLYRNDAGKFVKATAEAGLREPASWGAIGVALGDYDRDGDLDLFVNGLGGAPNRLYRNEGGFRFLDVTAKAGVAQGPHNGYVAFFTDYDNDAWPDLLVTSLAPWDAVLEGLKAGFDFTRVHPDSVRLYRNNHDGVFTDVTVEARLTPPMGVMGAGVADLDNDGFVDFYFGTGDPQMTRLEPNRFFRNNGDGTFSDITATTGFARPGNKGHGVCFVDIDTDGDLDVFAQLGGHYPGDHARDAFYGNLRGNTSHWIAFDLEGAGTNRFAVGAAVVARAGKLTVYREVKGGEGFGATNPYRVHMGLGAAPAVDSVEVHWPSGKVDRLGKLAADRVVRLKETAPPR
ncbi:MAG: FG-GAP-like repeat-containing protein [Bryobacteraceae bacterium]